MSIVFYVNIYILKINNDNRGYLLVDVISKHFKDEVSTIVSKYVATGSDTLISIIRGT